MGPVSQRCKFRTDKLIFTSLAKYLDISVSQKYNCKHIITIEFLQVYKRFTCKLLKIIYVTDKLVA